MSLCHPQNILLLLQKPRRRRTSSLSVSLGSRLKMMPRASDAIMCTHGPKQRIRDLFTKVEISVSAYDTAWVAMVPSPSSPQFPYFPECITWLLENQLPDGSWAVVPHSHPLLIKDVLSSTLACILALKRWNIGEEHIKKGLHFIVSNFSLATDEKQHSPIGFDIIFPGMIEYAKDMDLDLPLSPTAVDSLLHKRDLEFKRASGSNSEGSKAYLAYVSEGLGKLQDWEGIMKYQRKNGSLFNSPSITAAALTHIQDTNCLSYLRSVLERFGNAVPTTYPLDIYARLCMVDILVGLGIDRHFRDEIEGVLDETYRCWLQSDEGIFLDLVTCAMAFRILRMNGYDISSDALAQFDKEHFFDSLEGHLKDMCAVLELYKTSQILILPNESVLENQSFWLSHYLKQELSNNLTPANGILKYIIKEVDYCLKFPHYANLERLQNRRNMENYNVNNLRILKTSYRSLNIHNRDFLDLAVEDFNICQSIHRKELEHLERWMKENKLDKLTFARQKLVYCYFSAAATLFSPELSDARISWAKNSVLTTVVDDFFDIGGSEKELVNLIKLVEKWDGNSATDCSEQVEIIFLALHKTINEIGDKVLARQRRDVTSHLIEIWLDLLNSMMREAEWVTNKSVPTMDEYISNGYVSFALGPIVLPALYFIGPELSEEVVRGPEYHNLYKLLSTCGRLLNDVQGFKREEEQGKLNSVLLHMRHGHGVITEEVAMREIRALIDSSRRELLRLVLQTNGSVIPRTCKDLFWKMSKVLHLFYMRNDGFTSPREMVSFVDAVLHEPLNPLTLEKMKSHV